MSFLLAGLIRRIGPKASQSSGTSCDWEGPDNAPSDGMAWLNCRCSSDSSDTNHSGFLVIHAADTLL